MGGRDISSSFARRRGETLPRRMWLIFPNVEGNRESSNEPASYNEDVSTGVRVRSRASLPETFELCASHYYSASERRIRNFTDHLVFSLLLMRPLYPHRCWRHVWDKMAHAFSDVHPSDLIHTTSHSAICYQRARFDAEILHSVMNMCCKPICTLESHPDAFYHGRRLMAIDGSKFNVADTPPPLGDPPITMEKAPFRKFKR